MILVLNIVANEVQGVTEAVDTVGACDRRERGMPQRAINEELRLVIGFSTSLEGWVSEDD